jgi:hypothetical protein
MKKYISKSIFIAFAVSNIMIACKKTKTNTCNPCEAAKNTVYFALDWTGKMTYNNDIKKWVVHAKVPFSIDGPSVFIVCAEIQDSLKVEGKVVTFSSDVKESCAAITTPFGGNDIYSIMPSKIK